MSPRRGGEAEKFGNRYEGAWTVRQLFEVLFGHAEQITVEATGENGKGVEFLLMRGGVVEAHQVKRQRGSANSWTLRALEAEGVLAAAAHHVENGREFHFVSVVPSQRLARLAGRARRATELKTFVEGLLDGKGIEADFNYLSSEVWGSPQKAWEVLRGLHVRWPDEGELRDTNSAFAGVLLQGAPGPVAWLALGDLIATNLALPLSAEEVGARLSDYELRLEPLAERGDLSGVVSALTDTWRGGIAAEMLEPAIAREETANLAEMLEGEERLLIATGNAGAGKTGVLFQVLEQLGSRDWALLAFRLDRLAPFSSPLALGEQLGLPGSPASALAAAAGSGPSLLLVDQLDAVSLLSGRMPASFDAVAKLLREAAAFPEMRVLLACREFDIGNDNRLRALVERERGAQKFEIGPLSEEQVAGALAVLGVDADQLDASQLKVLSSPLHLVLLAAGLGQKEALAFSSSKDLFDLFWEAKARAVSRDRQPQPRFVEVIDAVVDVMSASQSLAIPLAVLDEGNLTDDADVLVSEHVLVREGQKLAFFHESFFDYAFARRWIRRGEGLVEFLAAGEQELFRRAQVRQVLVHLRDEDNSRFTSELEAVLLSDEIRFHVKDVVLRLIGSLPEPTHEEWQAVEKILTAGTDFESRVWASMRSTGWFDRLAIERKLAEWLASKDEQLRGRAIDILFTAVKERPDKIAALLAEHHSEEAYPRMLAWVSRFADFHTSRPLFELFLEAVKSGRLDPDANELWLDAHGLGETEPEWAIELLHAFFAERPESLALDSDGRLRDMEERDHSLLELISESSRRASEPFLRSLLPYLLAAMAATSEEGRRPRRDRHFGFRVWRADIHDTGDGLLYGMKNALVDLGQADPDALRPYLELLEADPHDAAQWLLYEGLRGAGAHYADWAAQILLQDESRLYSGYTDSSMWTTRELIETITPYIDDDALGRLEAALIELAPEWEGRDSRGYSSFTLLTALSEERLSEQGKRRLGELRRKFEREEPHKPMGIRVGWVGSPIPPDSARLMTDQQWASAIAKYSTGERANRIELRGDAEELASVLEQEAKRDPNRFARLGLGLDGNSHPAYANALLRGVGDPEADPDPELLFELVRHVAALGRTENDRWLGWALRGQFAGELPDDLIELMLDRALHSPDPEREAWQTEARPGKTFYGGDPWNNGMNTARGSSAESLASCLAHDVDGHRSAIVGPRLEELAADPSVAVRTGVARLLGAALRFELPAAIAAFEVLVDADDRLLAAHPVERLIAYVGRNDPSLVAPMIERMLASEYEAVREAGGRLAAFAGLELGLDALLESAADAKDRAVRRGAATVCAGKIASTSNAAVVTERLAEFFDDEDEEVRGAAAEVAGTLRGKDLDPQMDLLQTLIVSPAFPEALAQLLLTLEQSTDRVAELALLCSERFIATHQNEMHDIATRAAGDARHVGELVLRTYSQADGEDMRRRALDSIDDLLRLEAYGFGDLVSAAER
jgi:hypothetical protein